MNRGGRQSSASAVASKPKEPAEKKQRGNQSKSNNQSNQKPKSQANTGRLRQLPHVQPINDIQSRALRQTFNEVKDDLKEANVRRRTQKKGAQTIDSICQKLCKPLKTTVKTYKWELRNMHPFEKVVMDLTVRARQKKDGLSLSMLLDEVHEGRKEVLELSKDWIAKIKATPTARDAYECTEEAKDQITRVFLELLSEPWGGVMELQRSLRTTPAVRLDCPAVVLVGAPNVGKSSIVRAISSGTPEVNNYPFTTRGMTLGHVEVFWESDDDVSLGNVAGVSIPTQRKISQEKLVHRGVKTRRMREKEALDGIAVDGGDDEAGGRPSEETKGVMSNDGEEYEERKISTSNTAGLPSRTFAVSQLCQIMDSPGVLNRRDGNKVRNEMEELTLAAMSHLPTAVMYVMDLSGGAGDKCSSVEDQLVLRRELRARFPRRPWVDVISKVDLGVVDGARERLVQILEAEGGPADGFIELSIKEGQGEQALRDEVMRMLGEVRVVLDAMAAMDERSARTV